MEIGLVAFGAGYGTMYIVAVFCSTKTAILGMLCSLLTHSVSDLEDRQQVSIVCCLAPQHGVHRDHNENLKAHVEMNLWLPRPCSTVFQGH